MKAYRNRASRSGLCALLAALLCLGLAAAPALAKGKVKVSKPAKKAAVTLEGMVTPTLGKKGKVKGLVLATEDGSRYHVVLDKQGKRLAKAPGDARVEVTGKTSLKGKKGKEVRWLKVRKYTVLPDAPSPEDKPEVGSEARDEGLDDDSGDED